MEQSRCWAIRQSLLFRNADARKLAIFRAFSMRCHNSFVVAEYCVMTPDTCSLTTAATHLTLVSIWYLQLTLLLILASLSAISALNQVLFVCLRSSIPSARLHLTTQTLENRHGFVGSSPPLSTDWQHARYTKEQHYAISAQCRILTIQLKSVHFLPPRW